MSCWSFSTERRDSLSICGRVHCSTIAVQGWIRTGKKPCSLETKGTVGIESLRISRFFYIWRCFRNKNYGNPSLELDILWDTCQCNHQIFSGLLFWSDNFIHHEYYLMKSCCIAMEISFFFYYNPSFIVLSLNVGMYPLQQDKALDFLM